MDVRDRRCANLQQDLPVSCMRSPTRRRDALLNTAVPVTRFLAEQVDAESDRYLDQKEDKGAQPIAHGDKVNLLCETNKGELKLQRSDVPRRMYALVWHCAGCCLLKLSPLVNPSDRRWHVLQCTHSYTQR